MTNDAAPVGADAQHPAVADLTVEGIINAPDTGNEPSAPVPEDNTEPPADKPALTTEQELEKVRKALARKDRAIGKLTAQKYQAIEEAQSLKNKLGNPQPSASTDLSVAKTGIPTKLNPNSFGNYAEYLEARVEEISDFKISKKLSEFEGKNQETLNSQRISDWESQRSVAVDKMAEDFAKTAPDIGDLYEEYADTLREYPQELKHALLAADNPPLAFYNLAKEGKLDDLASMSLVDAKVEIRLAQMKEATKPKTKAPAPLPASRGSVPASKPLEKLSPREAWQLLNPKD